MPRQPKAPYPGVSDMVGAVGDFYGPSELPSLQAADAQGRLLGKRAPNADPAAMLGAGPETGLSVWRTASPVNRSKSTPDLMPADIIGTNMVMELPDGRRVFEFQPGPIFSQIVLADEINLIDSQDPVGAARSHARTFGHRRRHIHRLKEPFFVSPLRTRSNRKGRIRFLRHSSIGSCSSSSSGIRHGRSSGRSSIAPPEAASQGRKVLDGETLLRLQDLVRDVIIAPHVQDYAIRLGLATHPQGPMPRA